MTDVTSDTMTFVAEDGWELTGDLFRGRDPRIAVMITAGTGFPRRFYRHIAADLAARGAVVLTFDYRGIGDSGSENLATSGIEYPDWGRFDMAAALEVLAEAAPGLPLTHLGHSVGGQFTGFMPNADKIARNALVCVGSGYWGVHKPLQWPLEMYFWWLLGSFSLWRWGYFKPLGLSWEPLPEGVFRLWRRWSSRRSYLLLELAEGRWPHQFDTLSVPMASWVFSDDGIATKQAARDVLSWYPAAPATLIDRRPADYGQRSIGHAGAFRRGLEPLWDELWGWLVDGHLTENQQKIDRET
ncbi:alpha/beta fold hydrolase [uncultured Shimia sp.]|uniref:alpha/beta hydrolase family protein n=1 Tax=uncultured Shimia sp. TaxID=573152 RepID=UPI002624CA2C|nr:alpha/beta fold hydrolase [uncultured Shimia sp.]